MKTETITIIGLIILMIVLVSVCGYFFLEAEKKNLVIEKKQSFDEGMEAGENRLANQIIQGRRIETDTGIILFIPKQ